MPLLQLKDNCCWFSGGGQRERERETYNLFLIEASTAVGCGEGGRTGLAVPGHVAVLRTAADRQRVDAVGVAVTIAAVLLTAAVPRSPHEDGAPSSTALEFERKNSHSNAFLFMKAQSNAVKMSRARFERCQVWDGRITTDNTQNNWIIFVMSGVWKGCASQKGFSKCRGLSWFRLPGQMILKRTLWDNANVLKSFIMRVYFQAQMKDTNSIGLLRSTSQMKHSDTKTNRQNR